MKHPITRTILFMNKLQRMRSSDMIIMGKSFYSIAFSSAHFPKTLGVIVISSAVSGYLTMAAIHDHSLKSQDEMYASAWDSVKEGNVIPSNNTILVKAMVEKAKSSSLRENIENAAIAQEEFMRLSMRTRETQQRSKQLLNRITRRLTKMNNRSNL